MMITTTKRVFSLGIALVISLALSVVPTVPEIQAAENESELAMVEYLNRGIVAAATSTGATGRFVSWRFLASDPIDTTFRLYRDDTLIYTSAPGQPTSFRDTSGTATSRYRVDAIADGTVFCSQDKVIRADGFQNNQGGGAFFDIPLNPPPRGQHGGTYHPNDITVGDVDGDGQYELFVKWEPNNSRDAAQDGITDNSFIECITLEGESLWRIDLGPNIRSGPHYTQMLVADFQMNGRAMLIVKTADGTVDGLGNRIGSTAVHRNSNGRILTGDEFLTLFCGLTGENLHTIPYNPPIGNLTAWGNGRPPENRVNRFLGAVAYLDGVRPSAVTIRGYYTRMAAVAYDVVDNRLVERWVFDTGHNSSHPAFGQGNHNVMPAAVHAGSSRQSLFLGASAIRYDGELLWSSGRGHGDALHVGNFIPGRTQSNGIQVFSPFETAPYGIALFDGVSGEELWRQTASGDTGRAMAGNFVRSNTGAEFWGAGDMRGSTGQRLGNSPDTPSFAIWWDGGLERQLLNNTGRDEGWMRIDRVTNVNGDRERIFTAHATSINGTKANPNLSANIFGDWREQLIMREGNVLRVFTTTHSTEHRITTLMHDPHYRMQVAGQNICYNQPPHTSFYMGTGVEIQRVPVRVRGSAEPDPDLPDPDLPELCTLCDELPCVCPPPVARVVRLQQRELCELCGEDKIWQVTMLFAGADDETARLIRRAAKRNSAGAVLEPCEHSHSLEP